MMSDRVFHEIVNVLFLISCLFIVIPTLTILIIILYNWHNHFRSVSNLLMCNSCICLIFLAITYSIQTPSFIRQIYFDGSQSSRLFCQISACLATFSTGIVAHSCLVQAIYRFFLLILSKHKNLLTFRTNSIIILISWLINLLIAVGMFISPFAYQYDPESHFCTLTTHYFPTSFSISILFVFITALTLIILYGIILYQTIDQFDFNSRSRNRRNRKLFHYIIFTVSLHVLGGIPYIICLLMNRFGRAPASLYSIEVLSLTFTSAIHSIFLFGVNRQVRQILFRKRNQISSHPMNIRKAIQPLPAIS
ncbi:unnamed protein product [Adineta ricciae]|uniref:G-protein coupled receptors family 1 profile domain-containing protein n=1 Tax=Adineta ricciae TaxID=249248 RepID=A0A814V2C0_ADIRI|nr:unnamed protein product [Adineta ricciae]